MEEILDEVMAGDVYVQNGEKQKTLKSVSNYIMDFNPHSVFRNFGLYQLRHNTQSREGILWVLN